jgi:hypothetical protein
MITAVLLRSGMMGNYHVPFWRAVEEATPSLTLIILAAGLAVLPMGKAPSLIVCGASDLMGISLSTGV